jgi:hypothetical protein
MALWALNHMLDDEAASHSARVHLVPAPVSPTGNILDFRHSAYLLAEGYRLTRQWLAQAPSVAIAAA